MAQSMSLDNFRVHFFLEHQYHPDIMTVIQAFIKTNPNLDVDLTVRTERKHPFLASFNILDSYRESCQRSLDYFILAEEDILPSRDFLAFHDYVYYRWMINRPKIWGICHKRRHETEVPGDPSIVVGDSHCTSLALADVQGIKMFLLEHLCDEYFKTPHTYAARVFPDSQYAPGDHMDHDGQLERIMELNSLWCLRPDQGRTMHAGFYGGNEHYYNIKKRGEEFSGDTYLEKANQIKAILHDSGAMKERMHEYKEQIVSIDLDGYDWDRIDLDVDRTRCPGSPWFQDTENKFKDYYVVTR